MALSGIAARYQLPRSVAFRVHTGDLTWLASTDRQCALHWIASAIQSRSTLGDCCPPQNLMDLKQTSTLSPTIMITWMAWPKYHELHRLFEGPSAQPCVRVKAGCDGGPGSCAMNLLGIFGGSTQTRPVWDCHRTADQLTPKSPPQLIGIYASPMECLGDGSIFRSERNLHLQLLPPQESLRTGGRDGGADVGHQM